MYGEAVSSPLLPLLAHRVPKGFDQYSQRRPLVRQMRAIQSELCRSREVHRARVIFDCHLNNHPFP